MKGSLGWEDVGKEGWRNRGKTETAWKQKGKGKRFCPSRYLAAFPNADGSNFHQ